MAEGSEGRHFVNGKNVLVIGGTQGIGAGLAISIAKNGARSVTIVGRNRALADGVINEMKQASTNPDAQFRFIAGDLSLVEQIKEVVREISQAQPNIDILIQTQGGAPSGIPVITTEGHEFHFMVQVLSRFAFIQLLTSANILTPDATILSICAPGAAGEKKANMDDFEGKLGGSFFSIAAQGSLLIDAFHEELAIRYPEKTIIHEHPGIVRTDTINNLPWYLRLPFKLVGGFIAISPEQYSAIPLDLIAQGKEKLYRGSYRAFYYYKEKAIDPNAETKNEELRHEVVRRLTEILQP
eukprot:TRINITY_DN6464_c0_g2_i1.p1 TRINITY_DN6464_c0_g2~~TRINITY_DN6464_c0_g2_i1.p1  ORF type:complete len:297 (-),score=59.61 TRINITY_DN6464_c0_g2_i1:131-1021(-)